MNYIELFAGCGGLSLGLKSNGFKLLFANELSPMASESYAYNFLNEDLQTQAEKENPNLVRTLWLSSQYSINELKLRLREDPRFFPELGEGFSEVLKDGSNLNGSLVIGSIIELNRLLEKKPKIRSLIKNGFGSNGVDLVSGGPPCQSFSMAGLRRKDCEKNSLPWEFAKFAQSVQPKLVLLENVTGILRPFRDDFGNSYYAWFELAKAFANIGYVPLCLHVNAKFSGVPQNRPRFILLGVRRNYYDKLVKHLNSEEIELFRQPLQFYKRIENGEEEVEINALKCWDLSKSNDFIFFKKSFLAPLVNKSNQNEFVTVKDAIDDLRIGGNKSSQYVSNLNQIFKNVLPPNKLKNNDYRNNSEQVKQRFRIYQIIQEVSSSDTYKNVLGILKGEIFSLEKQAWEDLRYFDFSINPKYPLIFKSKATLLTFLKKFPTKKQTQKALNADQPAPAALSIPDDACHYHRNEQRTLTVREMARIQSFPDTFEFRSKVTTGGGMRSFEVPQYTQVGNAVPPILANALGKAISDLLNRVTDNKK